MGRKESIETAINSIQDVLIIGSGINGAVSAACLSAKGYQVTLLDKNDFASATSQESSNLIWGGIKYLERYEFKLVRHLCLSRNELLRSYPSQIKEIRFLATHSIKDTHFLNTYWLGCWFYWLIGNCFTQKPKKLKPKEINEIESCIITENSDGAVEYSDSYLPENDSRFVFQFVQTAKRNNAIAINYCEAIHSKKIDNLWETKCVDHQNNREFTIKSRVIINCGGPFADSINEHNGIQTKYHHLLSKGVHLIVPRIQKGNSVLTFLSDDKRPFYVIPMKNCSCIGTTDTPSPTATVASTAEDREFILRNINKRIKLDKPLTESDIIAERCGVRPLALKKGTQGQGDWVAISRKHEIETNHDLKSISIFGGKLTDCLNVAEEINDIILKWIPSKNQKNTRWYGDPTLDEKKKFTSIAVNFLAPEEYERVWSRYGNNAHLIFKILEKNPAYNQVIIPNSEYRFYDFIIMSETEDIFKLEDLLRRRTELALTVRKSTLKDSIQLKTICKIIFTDEFENKWNEYFSER